MARKDFIVVDVRRVWMVVVERRKCGTRRGRVAAKRFCEEKAGKRREAWLRELRNEEKKKAENRGWREPFIYGPSKLSFPLLLIQLSSTPF